MLLILLQMWWSSTDPWNQGANVIYQVGRIEIREQNYWPEESREPQKYRVLLRGKIDRGQQFPGEFQRLATTYHHRNGPAGVVLEKFNWFKGPANTYRADARLPASLVALGAGPNSVGICGALPVAQLGGLWSEPPIAVVGMYTGNFASYARPYQHLHFYENDANTIQLSLPKKKGQAPIFTFVRDAHKRGSIIQVVHQEERQALAQRGPRGFYHVIVLEICPRDFLEDISVNLLTREGLALLFDKLAPQGILCIHTSNRYFNVVPVIADVADSLGFACRHGRDEGSRPWPMPPRTVAEITHYSSAWVMVARKAEHLAHLAAPKGYEENQKKRNEERRRRGFAVIDEPYWSVPAVTRRHIWTDKSYSLFPIMYQHPAQVRWREIGWNLEDRFKDLPRLFGGKGRKKDIKDDAK